MPGLLENNNLTYLLHHIYFLKEDSINLFTTLMFSVFYFIEKSLLEVRGIDPRTSRMLSERSTI